MKPIYLFVIGSALGLVAYGFGISQGSTVMRAGSGIKIGTNERGTGSRGSRTGTVRGNSGVRIGEGRIHNSTRQRIIPSTPAPPPPQLFTHAPAAVHSDSQNITYLKVGMMVPYKSFGVREYTKAVTTALNNLQKSTRGPRLGLFQRYDIHVRIDMMELTPSPTGVRAFFGNIQFAALPFKKLHRHMYMRKLLNQPLSLSILRCAVNPWMKFTDDREIHQVFPIPKSPSHQ